MKKTIFATFSVKFLVAVINFLLLIVSAKYLGADIRGVISLIILGIAIIIIINDIIGGPALVYLIPRTSLINVVVPAYIWAIICSVAISYPLAYFNFVPWNYQGDVLRLSLLISLNGINLLVLLGKEKIRAYNILSLTQPLILIGCFGFFVFGLKETSIGAYINAMYLSFLISFVFSFVMLIRNIDSYVIQNFSSTLKIIVKNGSYTQIAALTHLLCNRVNYYFLSTAAFVGIYSSGVSVAEGVLLISGSASTILFTRISNSKDELYSQNLAINWAKFCFVSSLIAIIVLDLLPAGFYIFLFGSEFYQMKNIIISLSIGIVSLSFSTIFSHYFSATGKVYINTISSSIGLVVTLISAWFLVPRYNLVGAGLAASLSYLASAIFLFSIFAKECKIKYNTLFISLADIITIKNQFIAFIKTR